MNNAIKKISTITLLLTAVILSSCGRYGPPLAPEVLAPETVRDLKVVAGINSVDFEWATPLYDRRGEDLESIDGYLLQRKEVDESGDLIDDSDSFVTLLRLQDRSLKDLTQRKKQAREEGQLTRRVKPEVELQQFAASDTTVENGVNYVYRIVPINQNDVEGQIGNYTQVLFNGTESLVSIISESELLTLK